MSEWVEGHLGDWLRFRNGAASRVDESGEYPVFGANGVYGKSRHANLTSAAVIVGRVGSYCGSVHYAGEPAWISENALIAVSEQELSRFWYFALSHLGLNSWRSGSGQPLLNQSILRRIPFTAPPLADQRAIAEVLGALDDKIAANAALIAAADELMHRTFLATERTDRAPLSSIAAFVNGRAFTKGASGAGRVVVRIAELNSGLSGSTVYSDALVDEQHVVRAGDILFAWSGSLTLHRWFRDEAIVNQHIFKVTPNAETPAWLAYELIRDKLADFKATAADKATTMGHIQRHHLDEIVAAPSRESIASLDPLMRSLWSAALTAEQENLTLAATRDALLPRLMSGKLRVRDLDRTSGMAGL